MANRDDSKVICPKRGVQTDILKYQSTECFPRLNSSQPTKQTNPHTHKPTDKKRWPGGMRARALNPPPPFRGTGVQNTTSSPASSKASAGPAHSAGPPPKAHNRPLEIDQNFDHLLTSFLDRFCVVLECHLGVIFGTFGGQVGPSSVQNAS